MIDNVLIIIALICFGCAALGVETRINLVAAGLFLWLLTSLI